MAFGLPTVATVAVDVIPQVSPAALATGITGPISRGLKTIAFGGIAAGAVAVAGLGAALFSATKQAAGFEKQFSVIEGLVGISGDALEELKEAALDLAGETAKAPEELADALFFITSAGLEGQAAIDVLTTSAKASASGLGDTAVFADALTSALNAYGAENLSAAEAGDILVASVREGKLEAAEFAGTLGKVIPTASQLGIGFDQVGAAVAAFSRIGIDAASGTTALRAIMTTLLKPTTGASEALKDVGLSAAGLRDDLATGRLDLLGVLEKLNVAFDGNVEAITEVFPNVRALGGVFAVLGENADSAREIFDSVADATGSVDDAFAATAKTTSFKFEVAQKKLNVAMLRAGEQLLPLATRAAEKLADIVDALSPLFEKLASFVADAGEGLEFSFAGAIDFVSDLLGNFIGLFGNLGRLIQDGLSSITWDTFLLNIFGRTEAIIEGIFGPIPEQITTFFRNAIQGVSETLAGFGIGDVLADQLTGAAGTLDAAARATGVEIGTTIGEGVGSGVDQVLSPALQASLKRVTGESATTVREIAPEIAEQLKTGDFSGAFDGIKEAGAGIGDDLGESFSGAEAPSSDLLQSVLGLGAGLGTAALAIRPATAAVAGLSGGFAGLAPLIGSLTNPIGLVLVALGALFALSPEFREGIFAVFQALLPVLGELVAAILPVLLDLFENLAPIVKVLGEFLGRVLKALAPLLAAIVRALIPLLKAQIVLFDALLTAILPIVDALLSVLAPAIEFVAEVLIVLVELITPFIEFIAELVSGLTGGGAEIEAFFEQVARGFTRTFQFIGDLISTFVAGIGIIFDTIVTLWLAPYILAFDLIRALVTGLIDFVTSTFQEMIDFATAIFETGWQAITDVVEIATGLVTGFFTTIQEALAVLVGLVVGGIDTIKAAFASIGDGLGGAADKVTGFFSSLNPFSRGSPSLVENVSKGTGRIAKDFKNISGINLRGPNFRRFNRGLSSSTGRIDVTAQSLKDLQERVARARFNDKPTLDLAAAMRLLRGQTEDTASSVETATKKISRSVSDIDSPEIDPSPVLESVSEIDLILSRIGEGVNVSGVQIAANEIESLLIRLGASGAEGFDAISTAAARASLDSIQAIKALDDGLFAFARPGSGATVFGDKLQIAALAAQDLTKVADDLKLDEIGATAAAVGDARVTTIAGGGGGVDAVLAAILNTKLDVLIELLRAELAEPDIVNNVTLLDDDTGATVTSFLELQALRRTTR